jgi:hypothetical protein
MMRLVASSTVSIFWMCQVVMTTRVPVSRTMYPLVSRDLPIMMPASARFFSALQAFASRNTVHLEPNGTKSPRLTTLPSTSEKGAARPGFARVGVRFMMSAT